MSFVQERSASGRKFCIRATFSEEAKPQVKPNVQNQYHQSENVVLVYTPECGGLRAAPLTPNCPDRHLQANINFKLTTRCRTLDILPNRLLKPPALVNRTIHAKRIVRSVGSSVCNV